MTAFDVPFSQVKELTPGHALIIKKKGTVKEQLCRQPLDKSPAVLNAFISVVGRSGDLRRAEDAGKTHRSKVLEAVHYDYDHTIFSFIPNTAEVAFYGMMKGLEDHLRRRSRKKLLELEDKTDAAAVESILSMRPGWRNSPSGCETAHLHYQR